jgi:hypothetical protein
MARRAAGHAGDGRNSRKGQEEVRSRADPADATVQEMKRRIAEKLTKKETSG